MNHDLIIDIEYHLQFFGRQTFLLTFWTKAFYLIIITQGAKLYLYRLTDMASYKSVSYVDGFYRPLGNIPRVDTIFIQLHGGCYRGSKFTHPLKKWE